VGSDRSQRSYSFGRVLLEFTTIVVGVLFALAVDQWVDRQAERTLEERYVARLIQELEQDTATLRTWVAEIDEKEESLKRVDLFLRQPSSESPDPGALVRDLATGTNFAWNVGPLANSATYDDLRGSGNLGLIADTEVRFKVVQYYHSAEGRDRRIEARRTGFPDASYMLFLRSDEADEVGSDPSLTDAGLRAVLSSARDASLGGQVLAEINRARFLRGMLEGLGLEAVQLLDQLKLYAEGS